MAGDLALTMRRFVEPCVLAMGMSVVRCVNGVIRRLNCRDNYDPSLAPGGHWKGSMVAQAARDPSFFGAMTVAAQDSEWAVGRPNHEVTWSRSLLHGFGGMGR